MKLINWVTIAIAILALISSFVNANVVADKVAGLKRAVYYDLDKIAEATADSFDMNGLSYDRTLKPLIWPTGP